MSEAVLTEPNVESAYSEVSSEFNYRPVSALAVVSLFFGLCSFIALLTVFGLSIALFGAILGIVSFIQVQRSKGEIGGKWFALSGMVLSMTMFISGISLHSYNYATEVPDGFERINFSRNISRLGFVNGAPHPNVQELDGKPIFLKGYMYPTGQTEGITSFVLVKDTGQCCFGGQPAAQDMIRVVMKNGNGVEYREGMVSVAGTFHINGNGNDNTGLTAVYQIDGDYFESSRFSF